MGGGALEVYIFKTLNWIGLTFSFKHQKPLKCLKWSKPGWTENQNKHKQGTDVYKFSIRKNINNSFHDYATDYTTPSIMSCCTTFTAVWWFPCFPWRFDGASWSSFSWSRFRKPFLKIPCKEGEKKKKVKDLNEKKLCQKFVTNIKIMVG